VIPTASASTGPLAMSCGTCGSTTATPGGVFSCLDFLPHNREWLCQWVIEARRQQRMHSHRRERSISLLLLTIRESLLA
jgi:hypothetical protein